MQTVASTHSINSRMLLQNARAGSFASRALPRRTLASLGDKHILLRMSAMPACASCGYENPACAAVCQSTLLIRWKVRESASWQDTTCTQQSVDAGMHSLRVRRPWVWLAPACLLALWAAGVVFNLSTAPDGSEEVMERVQLGMSPEQVGRVLEGKGIMERVEPGMSLQETLMVLQDTDMWVRVGCLPGRPHSAYGLFCSFRDYDVFLEFDGERLVEKSRVRNHGAWHSLLFYWCRIRAELGV